MLGIWHGSVSKIYLKFCLDKPKLVFLLKKVSACLFCISIAEMIEGWPGAWDKNPVTIIFGNNNGWTLKTIAF